MAVKKTILDNFLKPGSQYSSNQKNFRAIFIEKSEDDFKDVQNNFLESSIIGQDKSKIGTHQERSESINRDTIGTQDQPFSKFYPPESDRKSLTNLIQEQDQVNEKVVLEENAQSRNTLPKTYSQNSLIGTQPIIQ